MSSVDAAVVALARRQHGVVTRDQLRQCGATDSFIRTNKDKGRWTVAACGVLRIGGAPVTWESQLLAHTMAAGSNAMASHRSAAVLWRIEGCHQGTPELTIPRGRRYWPSEARVHASTDLHLVEPVLRAGIPTTPVARTLLDLGAVLPLRLVHVAIDDARRHGLTNWDRLLATLVAHARRGRRGVGVLRAILDEHYSEVAMTESGFERLVVATLRQAGLPAPELQHEVKVGTATYRLDLAYPKARVAIELDGSHHLRREVWEADHARQNALMLAGWTVLRFTWKDYLNRRSALVREVRASLARARPELAAHPAESTPDPQQVGH